MANILQLVNNLLDVYRLNSDKEVLNKAPFLLNSLLERIAHEYTLSANDKGLRFLKDFKSVEVSYTDNEGEQRTILVGKGEPKFRSVQNFKTDTEAIQWAQTRLKVLQNQKIRGSLTMVGGVFFAGAFLDLSLRGKKHRMLIKEITHDISPENWEIKMTFESIN